MSKWILTVALAGLMACDPQTGPGFGSGSNGDDTGPTDDTSLPDTSECPPTFGDVTASIDDYPGIGWVAEVLVPFTEGACKMDEGKLWLEREGSTGDMITEGPFDIGFDDEKVQLVDYTEETGEGTLFFVFPVDSASDQVVISLWVAFDNGTSSERVEVTAGG